ncbi:ubiquitin carboxyl-terminal hydrolase 25 [Silene latifolia]|uniref:ubiquitin carboxyl-terminal hydrolase 25 n=1 Tax=Silene latifolia TaxID=37657 RepID=UPI003D7861F5
MVGFLLMEAEGVGGERGKIQMNWISNLLKRKNGGPLGLRNLGNTCYLNSVLQCLTYTPPLANFCLGNQHSTYCDSAANPFRKKQCPFCLLENRIVRSLSIDLTLDAPAKILSCLEIFSENFKSGRQEDAHEFLRYVIDACHDTCLRLKKLQQQRSKKTSNGIGKENFGSSTIVKDIFGGALQSQIKCLSCGNESNKVDEIMDICLEISGCSSLKEAMRKFFQAESLDGNNKYKCERCTKLVTAKKQMSLLQAPNVLVVQLKRFEGIFGGKIDRVIAFEEILVLSSFMCKASQDPNPEYTLFATIVHSGFSPESGHYYAYIKDAVGRWFCCNDSYVTLSTLQEVLTEKAYILFFTRTSQRPVSVDTTTMSNGVKSHTIATVPNGLEFHAVATVSNGVKPHARNGNIMCKSPKSTAFPKAVNMKPFNVRPVSKVAPVASKVNGASSALQNKSNGHANSFAGKDSPSDPGSHNLQKKESVECDGNIGHVVSERVNGNGICSQDNQSCVDGKQNTIKSSQDVGNGNSHIENGHVGSEKDLHKDNSLKDKIVGKMPVNGDAHSGLNNGRVSVSGSKRKLEDKDTCILLAKDAHSRTQVEHFKEVLHKEASLSLQASGWSDKLYQYMRSRKRLCMDTCTSTDTIEQKKALIAEAKTSFISQIPGSLKLSLIERIKSFSRGN